MFSRKYRGGLKKRSECYNIVLFETVLYSKIKYKDGELLYYVKTMSIYTNVYLDQIYRY
jgi:small nuclear ribonucleoprotein (snRNP)-like protein